MHSRGTTGWISLPEVAIYVGPESGWIQLTSAGIDPDSGLTYMRASDKLMRLVIARECTAGAPL